ncbi:hypothetical protein M422DRAFT_39219 [Sphaerobolus stellatus SS14]|uniref:Unplaced genomic scaffold SPHSTscaffold_429, whole genome shotgun sequence n=1 Tax=Sphaerobolus stellatus (strain SS14) TaxID=990650 RepID=A0A0C9UFS3_SPHS4|nr:hypothetical protein M422DRAFT_39219 [Sphaerobolus stellatus SS14]
MVVAFVWPCLARSRALSSRFPPQPCNSCPEIGLPNETIFSVPIFSLIVYFNALAAQHSERTTMFPSVPTKRPAVSSLRRGPRSLRRPTCRGRSTPYGQSDQSTWRCYRHIPSSLVYRYRTLP